MISETMTSLEACSTGMQWHSQGGAAQHWFFECVLSEFSELLLKVTV